MSWKVKIYDDNNELSTEYSFLKYTDAITVLWEDYEEYDTQKRLSDFGKKAQIVQIGDTLNFERIWAELIYNEEKKGYRLIEPVEWE